MKTVSVLAVPLTLLLAGTCAGAAGGVRSQAQLPQGGEIEQLRAQLEQPGPEAADARLAAIENLIGMLEPKAHAILQDKIRDPKGVDGVRLEILDSLARHLRNRSDPVFGVAAGEPGREQRQQILRSYVPALVEVYRRTEETGGEEPRRLREAARSCLVRMPVREVEAALRQVVDLPSQERATRQAAFRVAADCQDLYLARFLADYLEAPDPAVRAAARANLRLLTFSERPIADRAQFEEWWREHGAKRYLDLVEETARGAESRLRALREQYEERLTDTIVTLVLALYENRTAVDWAAIQRQVLAPDPAGVTMACLQRLRERLQDDLHAGNNTPQRQAFHKALLERLGELGEGQERLEALLLETAAYLLRPDEAQLAAGMVPLLLDRLQSPHPEVQRAALRGLRRFPSPENRAAVLRAARAAMDAGDDDGHLTLRVALETLGRTVQPSWHAPSPEDPDKGEWLDFLRAMFQRQGLEDLRLLALGVARLPDRSGRRLPEVFQELVGLAKDQKQSYELRKTSLIYLQDYTNVEERADTYVREVIALLDDPEREIRAFAASLLGRLPDNHGEAKRRQWIQLVVDKVRSRLLVEDNLGVFQSLVTCLTNCARPPGSPELIIGSLLLTMEKMQAGQAQASDEPRTEALLQALTTLAAEPLNDPGQWIVAGERLLAHGKRKNLRLVLASQHAIGLSADIASQDEGKVERAKRAMWLIVRAAALRSDKEPWTASDALREEANDVRGALAALDSVRAEVDTPAIRLLRVRVLHDLGLHQEVTTWTDRYLQGDPQRSGLSAEQLDAMRLLAADSHLAQGQLDRAAGRLAEVDASRRQTAEVLDLAERLGRAYLGGDAAAAGKALPWLEQAATGTKKDAPRYRHRLLAYAEGLLKADAAANRQKVNELLDADAALFEKDCPKELRDAYQALRGAN